ncbi:hypothetical protein AB3N04_01045 (plasmid) [Alkalihalophilus sp. As8PL]|uniref:NADH dehydrogenase subunit 3 n=1 Tax=Alkalihalophilus sp. As8PL TaxID=3237103 RepID=A0AB39BND1_9BACI
MSIAPRTFITALIVVASLVIFIIVSSTSTIHMTPILPESKQESIM